MRQILVILLLGLFALATTPIAGMAHGDMGMHDCPDCAAMDRAASHDTMTDTMPCPHGAVCLTVALVPSQAIAPPVPMHREAFQRVNDPLVDPTEPLLDLPPPRA